MFLSVSDNRKSAYSRHSARVRTPSVIQMEAAECGAACLAMILAYYGRFVPLERLRNDCGVSRDGSKASNVVKAAREYGLIAKGVRAEPEQLKTMTLPVIVFWNFNHFVVVEGFDRKTYFLNDPASGHRTVTAEEFDESFTGVVLTFKPGPEFRKGGRKPSMLAALKRRARGLGTPIFYAVLAGLALALIGLVITTFSKIFVDRYLVDGLHDWIRPLLWAMVLTVIVKIAVTWLQESILLRLEMSLALRTSGQFFAHVLRLPVQFFSQRYAGEVVSRIALNNQVAQILSGRLAANIILAMMGVFFIAIMLQYDLVMTLVGIGIAALNVVALAFVSNKRKDLNKRLLQEYGKLTGFAMGGLQTVETIKAGGLELDFFSKWAGYQAKAVNSEQELNVYTQWLDALPPFLTIFNTMVMLGLGGMRVMQGVMTMGELVAFQALMTAFTTPFNNVTAMGSQLQEAEGSMQRLDDVLDNQPDPLIERTEALPIASRMTARLSGRTEVRNLTFGYSRLERPLIEDFHLTLSPGSRVALVGGSGSGKSTIAMLIAGLLEPWEGEILFDGKPRSEIPRDIMTASVAMVDQTIMMFRGSVHDNLTLWDDTVPSGEVVKAAQDAMVHDVVAARAGGYQSEVAEDGTNFSGGQRQRLEIARALVVHPTLLILDEATSALDPLTENHIDDRIRQRGCTALIIAHRLSTIRDSDEIIVLERGRVVERGTHEEMRSAGGPYAKLIREY
jgi:NHLM bacteriocin system ABC transporter peptidase/ATP-binding protein